MEETRESKNEKAMCPICDKYKTKYIKSSDICQSCYRKLLSTYSFYKYRDERIKPNKGTLAFKICEKIVNENMRPVEIAKIYDCNKKYAMFIMREYLIRCDTYGNERPQFMKD